MRVYRRFCCPSVKYSCSLIICEGISTPGTGEGYGRMFPHYMWGYIMSFVGCLSNSSVPSLYVRVYRVLLLVLTVLVGSLIICEGISNNRKWHLKKPKFPHYMWGYITKSTRQIAEEFVPSLYVRVYRVITNYQAFSTGSLIICDGISELSADERLFISFPHYMWGYIVRNLKGNIGFCVPSLYVRVYRFWS